ncbi:metalloprotease TldD [uncultured Parasutterella sp.]|uniref:metalloprotease TldD n=1 Tax=uncultured Parasutterella sp. TaxID=1263098 RepID=UPI00272B2EDC|nr:metalloprotease TldD [uncultured Parasutterella sp.]
MSFENTSTAVKELLYANGIDENMLKEAFALFSGFDIDYADFYFQRTVAESYVLEESIIKTGDYSTDIGVGVRAVSGEKHALAYSDVISKEALFEAVKTVRAIGASAERETTVKVTPKEAERHLYEPINPIELAQTSEKIELVKRLELFARARSPLITQVTAHVASSHDMILIAKMDGTLIGDIRPLVRMGLQVIVRKGDNTQTGFAGGGGRFGLSYFTDSILGNYAAQAVDAAVRNLEAIAAPAGSFPVVLGSGWPGVLLHEAVGHGLEADFIRKGTSVFTGRVSERVASPLVTVIDDGTIVGRRGSLAIDDEGNLAACTTLIDEGVLRGFMHDEMSARLMNLPLTGNGRRESFAHLPMPRMTNTYMLEGETDPQEIIESVDYGIYASNFGGGQVDITNGNFVFSMSEAWLIEKGRLTAPVKGATLTGNGADALTKIVLVGSDLKLDQGNGVCGKNGQHVPTGVGMPTLRIDGLTVGGTATA